MTAKEILKDLVAINTIADKDNDVIMDYIGNFFTGIGFNVERRKSDETGKEVLIARYGDDPAIGFLGHTDTVDITDGWTTDPFVLTEADGELYGLGACDMKGGIAAFMAAIGNTDLSKLKRGLTVYCTYDEEIMFGGIKDLEILSQAEDYVYIFTPYLIIDNEMKTSLELAAKRGVDVRIVTPAIPDKKTIFRLTRSYYRPLMKAGVRIYEYTPGFMHAKSYLSDDKIGVVGTINMDYRSLFLHFECGTLLIGCQALYDLKKDCEAVFGVSREMHQEDCRRGFFGVLADSLLRVLSPLL